MSCNPRAAAFANHVLAALAIAAAYAGAAQAEPLPRLGADLAQTSVSGLSSGAYMATQFQFAHGRIVVGAGIVAGGPFACAESADNPFVHLPGVKAAQALEICVRGSSRWLGLPDASTLARKATRWADDGRIDPLGTIASDRVYIFTGSEDDRVATSVVDAAAALYRRIGVAEDRLQYSRNEIAAAHAFVTEAAGAACGSAGSPFLNDCDFDLAGAILKHILGALDEPSPRPAGALALFDQGAAGDRAGAQGLAEQAFAYIPEVCRARRGCRVHVAFHGCRQSREFVGDAFATQAGFNRWADANELVILYPQTGKSTANPLGCWDWWGYTGAAYYAKQAPQIAAVRAMLDRLAEAPE